jgi:peptidoglycan/LPS O-acetylase OafA/YrhL
MARTTLPERNLDVLRAIAVLLVFANHIINALVGHGTLIAAWVGRAGVQAFFVHTSLVLMASLERDGAPQRSGWIQRFYVRRILRIYPLAIAAVMLVLILHVPRLTVFGHNETYSIGDILANFALVQSVLNRPSILGVLWTLPLELQMYIALPLCYLAARKPSFSAMALLLLAGLALPEIATRGIDTIPGIWRLPVLKYVPCFLAGVLAYWLLRRPIQARLSSWLWIPIVAADLVLGYLASAISPDSWVLRAAFCGLLGIAIPLVANLGSSRLTDAAHVIATYSYGIYLLHPVALWFGFNVLRDQSPLVRFIGIAGSLTLGCYVAYRFIERPGIELGRSLFHARATLETEPAAP